MAYATTDEVQAALGVQFTTDQANECQRFLDRFTRQLDNDALKRDVTPDPLDLHDICLDHAKTWYHYSQVVQGTKTISQVVGDTSGSLTLAEAASADTAFLYSSRERMTLGFHRRITHSYMTDGRG